MAAEDFGIRFGEELMTVYDNSEISYPLYLRDSEIVVIYNAEKIDEEHFHITEIERIIARELVSGELSRLPVGSLLSSEAVSRITGTPFQRTSKMVDCECMSRYHKLYDNAVKVLYKDNPDDSEVRAISDYYNVLNTIAGDGGLRCLYLEVGKELFSYCQKILKIICEQQNN